MPEIVVRTREQLSRLYRQAVETGEPSFTELREGIMGSVDLPMSWWVAALLPSILNLEGGHPAMMTPDEFDALPDGEADFLQQVEAVGRRKWTPERQRQTDETYASLMALASLTRTTTRGSWGRCRASRGSRLGTLPRTDFPSCPARGWRMYYDGSRVVAFRSIKRRFTPARSCEGC